MSAVFRLWPSLVVLGLLASPARAEEHVFVTSGGVPVPTPPLAELDCTGLSRVLSAIDGSGYRGFGPTPGSDADRALRAYEDGVSRRWFVDCVNGPAAFADAEGAFRHGFDAQPDAQSDVRSDAPARP